MATIATAIRLNDMMSAPLRSVTNAMNMMLSSWTSLDGATSKGLDIGDVEAIRSELDSARRSLDQMGDAQEEFNDEVKRGITATDSLGKTIAGVVATLGLAKVANDAIEYASDLQEVQNVVDVTFDESAAVIDQWSTTTLDAFGLSELSAKQFAGTMGAMLKSSGINEKYITGMSQAITELSGDMASFYNLSGEDAFAKIRAGISGETEPLKQLGINMSVANLEAFALANGIETSYEKMSQAEQVMLRYNYLMQATADAQGDFARTSDSFANQQKLLTENWQQFTGTLAASVLPMLAAVMGFLNSTIAFISENWSIVAPIILGVAAALGVYLAATKGVELATRAWAAAQAFFNGVMSMNPIFIVIMGVILLIALISALIGAYNKATGSTISVLGIIVGAVTTAIAFIWNLVLSLLDVVLGVINALVNPFINLANFVGNVFTDPIGAVIHLFGDMADCVLGVLESIAKAMDKIFGSNMASTVQGWRSGLDSMVESAANKYGNGSYEKVAEHLNLSSESLGLSRWAYSDAWNYGYDLGEGVGDSVGGIFSGTDLMSMETMADYLAETPTMEDIASNTGSIDDSLKDAKKDLSYLRKIADTEWKKEFTTNNVKIDMTNNNTINDKGDLKGWAVSLRDILIEELDALHNGSYA